MHTEEYLKANFIVSLERDSKTIYKSITEFYFVRYFDQAILDICSYAR